MRHGLSVVDGVAVLVGVVVGVGIFGFPPLVAQHAGSAFWYLLLWVAGGALMLVGALCYAELGASYPHHGGEYHYLRQGWGARIALLFAWARGTVIQTGAIATVAFIYGEYAQRLLPLGAHGPAWHGALAVGVFTALNMLGTRESGQTQRWLSGMTLLALLCMLLAGLFSAVPVPAAAEAPVGVAPATLAMGMVFVLLTYGGWNEAAYLSGELRDPTRDVVRVLVLGALLITALYVLANWVLLEVFGLAGLRASQAVGAELMARVAGPSAAALFSLLICCAALSTLNATVLTGGRLYYALGQDVPRLAVLGRWDARGQTPGPALALQGLITLLLVLFGSTTGNGVETMVAYTAPVFWLFMALTALSLVRLRRRHPGRARPFRVPLYPWLPLVFAASCLGLFWSSALYAGSGAWLGLLVLLAGLPLLWLRQSAVAEPAE